LLAHWAVAGFPIFRPVSGRKRKFDAVMAGPGTTLLPTSGMSGSELLLRKLTQCTYSAGRNFLI